MKATAARRTPQLELSDLDPPPWPATVKPARGPQHVSEILNRVLWRLIVAREREAQRTRRRP